MRFYSNDSRPQGCIVTSFIVGGVLILAGFLWHIPPLTSTDGVIVETKPSSYGSTRRLIKYEYIANGVRYRGERFLRYWYINLGKFDIGSKFPVYYVTSHPEESYAPNRPLLAPLIVIGMLTASWGFWALFLSRRS